MTVETNMNIFEKGYHLAEMEFYREKLNGKTYDKDGVELFLNDLKGFRLDGSMYQYYNEGYVKDAPTLMIDGDIWMSLTPMEIETHYVPIQKAKGRVGVAGLGAGYFALRAAEKKEVSEVVVYEIDERVIEMFEALFGEQKKIKIVKKNVFEVENEKFDFFYNDIYLTMMDNEAFSHIHMITEQNDIKDYHFWTQEVYFHNLIEENYQVGEFPYDMEAYLNFSYMFAESDKYQYGRNFLYAEDIVGLMEEEEFYWFYEE